MQVDLGVVGLEQSSRMATVRGSILDIKVLECEKTCILHPNDLIFAASGQKIKNRFVLALNGI